MESKEGVRLTFPDGHTADCVLYDGATMPLESLGEVLSAIVKPTPTMVEIIPILSNEEADAS
jgi:hypothetical protein